MVKKLLLLGILVAGALAIMHFIGFFAGPGAGPGSGTGIEDSTLPKQNKPRPECSFCIKNDHIFQGAKPVTFDKFKALVGDCARADRVVELVIVRDSNAWGYKAKIKQYLRGASIPYRITDRITCR